MSSSSKPSSIAGGLTAGYRPTWKPAKKDRHSKIATAKGPRDRRMRLSLEVARKFFRLQDKLGFDKASKTVEWLLDRAWPEIKKLDIFSDEHQYPPNSGLKIGGSMSFSSDGECLTAECIVEQACGAGDHEARSTITYPSLQLYNKKEAAVNINANQQKRTICLTIARESRAMARERARKRTREKLLQVMSKVQQYHSSMQGSSAGHDHQYLQLDQEHDQYQNNYIGCKPAAAASMIYSSAASRESRNYNYSSSTADDFNYMENVHYGTSTDHDHPASSFLESISNSPLNNILPNIITNSHSTSTVPAVVTSSCTNNYNTLNINDEPAVFASSFCFGTDSLDNLYTNILGGRMNYSAGNLQSADQFADSIQFLSTN